MKLKEKKNIYIYIYIGIYEMVCFEKKVLNYFVKSRVFIEPKTIDQ